MSEDQELQDALELLKKAARSLGEHFDSVQIYCTRHIPDEGAESFNFGIGNWYARYGQVAEWMIKQDEDARLRVRKDDQEEED